MQSIHFLSVRAFLRVGQSRQLHHLARSQVKRELGLFILPKAALNQSWSWRPTHNSRLAPLLLRLRTFSTPPTTLVDPSRPSLFYHLIPAPNPISTELPAYAVSLLNRPPKDAQSQAIMGWLPAAVRNEGGEEAGLGDFKENLGFLNVLHQVIQKAIEEGTDERLKAEAIQLGEGWMHVNDDRNLPEMGRISSPDDIIASVRVEGGEMLPETYNPMPAYRICTTDGLTKLSQGLEHRLLETLQRIEGQ